MLGGLEDDWGGFEVNTEASCSQLTQKYLLAQHLICLQLAQKYLLAQHLYFDEMMRIRKGWLHRTARGTGMC